MKKLLFLFLPLLALIACTSEYDKVMNDVRRAERSAGDDIVFYATIEGADDTNPQTKVYADEQLRVLWNADDRISIFNKKTNNQEFQFKGEDGDNAGNFEAVGTIGEGNVLSYIYAVYPYASETSIDDKGLLSFSLPSEQIYLANSFGKGANTMVSVTEDNILQFKNAGGYLSFKFYGEGISVKSIMLKGNNHEKLAGKATITMSVGGTPTVVMQNDATESITLLCDEPVALNALAENYTEFWFVIPPTTFEQGFTITVTDARGGIFTQSTTSDITLVRNQLNHMAVMKVVPEYPYTAVDLGLPSGLKWATCNVGATRPEDYGDYFAWGETKPFYAAGHSLDSPCSDWIIGKTGYDWASYGLANGDGNKLTKYCNNASYGDNDFADNLVELQPEDDVARVNWGGGWRMPTEAECTELLTKCTWTWTTQNGTNGRLVTGPNGNSIFLPFAGYRYGTDLNDAESHGYYWSSSIFGSPGGAYGMYFGSGPIYGSNYERSYGQSVRPVNADPISVSGVSLDRTAVTLYICSSTQLVATVLPENADEKGVTWSSNNPLVASVSTDGLVIANQAGSAVITVKTIDGGFEATCQVTVNVPSQQEAVDLGLPSGLKWATCNVGANSPEEYGDYFAWGETSPKDNYQWDSYKWCNGDYNKLTKYCNYADRGDNGFTDNLWELQPEDDAARANWGDSWRMPTDAEWTELRTECTWIWTTQNGVYGQLVTGPNGNHIFLPAAGYRYGTYHGNPGSGSPGSDGSYWSSSLLDILSSDACYVYFNSGGVDGKGYNRHIGRSVRPVYGEKPTQESVVDLGLPSGLKWATCNVGADSPEEYGDYFAWGETAPKENYDWSTYKWCNGSVTTLTKYNTSSGGTVDNKTILDMSDDAARANWGSNWRMPTDAECTELITECTWTWTTQKGKNGYKVTGPNGNSIFLPAGGYQNGTKLYYPGGNGNYWSSSLYTAGSPSFAFCVYFNSGGVGGNSSRSFGHSVRPVYADFVSVSSVSLNRTEITLYAGYSIQMEAFILPANASEKGVTWSSSDLMVASVSTDGIVTANQAGNAVITVTTIDGGFEASCQVTVYTPSSTAVDLGLPSGLKWATCNVGANCPEEYGDFFAWGEAEPKNDYSWATYKWCAGSYNSFTKYNYNSNYGTVDNKTVLDLSDDAARTNWEGKWRMPTDAEWTELRTECTWTWTTQNGTNGRLVTGPNGNSIFLPAAGYQDGSKLYFAGSLGYYWSSSLDTGYPGSSCYVIIGSGGVNWGGRTRCSGQSVRPVYGDPISVSGVSLNKTEITLYTGNSIQLEATVLPANASDKGVIWSSNNPSMASVSTDGLVTANQAGNAVITVTTVDGGFEATCQVTVNAQYEAVDLGLPSGLKWATFNVGANAPEEYGDYFAWGETKPKSEYTEVNYKYANGAYNKLTKYCNDSSYGNEGFTDTLVELQAEDDAARANWGGNWRMPTDAEWTELITKCTWTRTTQNGTNGSLVTGPNGNSIFLPAAGWRYDANLNNTGPYGVYWSSSLYTDGQYPDGPYLAHYVYFYSGEVRRRNDFNRRTGLPVRPVTE